MQKPQKRRKLRQIKFGGIREAQARILKALDKVNGWVNRANLSELSGISVKNMAIYLGQVDRDANRYNEERSGFKTLKSLCLVKFKTFDIDGKSEELVTLTPKGKEHFQTMPKEGVEKLNYLMSLTESAESGA